MSACLTHIHALRPLHLGVGSADGAIDLPHSREASTGYPNAPGSGLKGVIRNEVEGVCNDAALIRALFGPKPQEAGSATAGVQTGQQGALMFSDGLLLCLPVRSYLGGFAWISSLHSLLRYERERIAFGLAPMAAISQLIQVSALKIGECAPCTGSTLPYQSTVYLQDLILTADNARRSVADAVAQCIAQAVYPDTDPDHRDWRDMFQQQFLVVPEAVFAYFCDFAMDVRPRIRLKDDNKTVVKGGHWHEENLPAESILWASVAADPASSMNAQQVMQKFIAHSRLPLERAQIGGKATIGRGIVRCLVGAQP